MSKNVMTAASAPTWEARAAATVRGEGIIGRPSEPDLRRPLYVFGDGEGLHRLIVTVQHRGPDPARKCAELRVVELHCLDVVAPRHRDPILGAFELGLQRQEILVRLELGIALRGGEQSA